jgi:hypothetical protein
LFWIRLGIWVGVCAAIIIEIFHDRCSLFTQ